MIGAADTSLMELYGRVCERDKWKAKGGGRGCRGEEVRRDIQKGAVRRLWRIILCRGVKGQGGVSKDRNWLSAASVACVQMPWSTMKIIRKQWFLDLTGKSVFPLGHHAVETMVLFKSRLAHIFWMKLFSVYSNRTELMLDFWGRFRYWYWRADTCWKCWCLHFFLSTLRSSRPC